MFPHYTRRLLFRTADALFHSAVAISVSVSLLPFAVGWFTTRAARERSFEQRTGKPQPGTPESSVARAQKSKCVPTTTPPRDETVRLKLRTSIAQARYSVEYGTKVLRLSLSLDYRNVGTRPILLDKKSSRIYRQLVSKDLRAVSACKYLHDISSHFIGGQVLRASVPERSEFITLNSGESVDLKDEIILRLYDGSKDTKDDLHPGKYVLVVRVAAWFHAADPVEWEQKWGNQAYLWSENVTSEPMPFTIEKSKSDAAKAIPPVAN